MRATIVDLAKASGVSIATVDRVLNDRKGVKPRTRNLVLEAARRIGYIASADSQPSLRESHEPVRLQFILPVGTNQFIQTLHDHLLSLAKVRAGIEVQIASLDSINPDHLTQKIRSLPRETQGLGIIAVDHPSVREAIRALVQRHVKVLTMVSDIHHVPRIAYVGIDNRAAGRLAGYLVRRFLRVDGASKVALFTGSLSYRGHEEREMGFRNILSEEVPSLRIVQLREIMDDEDRAYEEASGLLESHPDVAAIYNVGAGLPGIAKALKERELQHKIVLVGHEATPRARELLLDGTLDAVIDQNPRVEAREALNILESAVRDMPLEIHPPRLQVIFKENIPEH
ncbi:MAG: LacI family transcriptional regulator [Rhizobiales bacterium]|nr:LacI family transcriptional regulator [Hyphomicrobiales bacterium]